MQVSVAEEKYSCVILCIENVNSQKLTKVFKNKYFVWGEIVVWPFDFTTNIYSYFIDNDCSSVNETTLKDMGKYYMNLWDIVLWPKQKKAKQNQMHSLSDAL